MSIEHYMMFGTFAEQRHFVYPSDQSYNGVIFNANIVAHAPAGLAGFLVTRTNRLPYFIDPLTHAFQHAPAVVSKPETGEPKKAIRALADYYGNPVSGIVGRRAVIPSDFLDDGVRKDFVRRVLEFQRYMIKAKAQDHDDSKYFTLEELEDFAPKALVAPYFFLTENNALGWLRLNAQLANEAVAGCAETDSVYSEIVVGRWLLTNNDAIDNVVEAHDTIGLDGHLLWVDELDEHRATQTELRGLVELCRRLKSKGRTVTNLHGSYFSIMAAGTLGRHALTGVTHGPEYGEMRAVVPVGGGLPVAKYYLPLLHRRLSYRDALAVLRAKGWLNTAAAFHQNVCDCQECLDVINGDIGNFVRFGESTTIERKSRNGIVRIDYPTQEARLRCLRHYLNVKQREYAFACGDVNAIVANLSGGISEFEPEMGYEGVAHLYSWRAVLTE